MDQAFACRAMRLPSAILPNPTHHQRSFPGPWNPWPSLSGPGIGSRPFSVKPPEPLVLRWNGGGGKSRTRCELQGLGYTGKDDDDGDDGFYMRRCVELARRAVGCTSPNPMVGCVIVKDGIVVGEGFHPKAGHLHAEVFALRDAGKRAECATAYVSLEPCNHHGRTPPCTEALINAKVARVVVGMVDPNPIVASKGVEKLRQSGISVTIGVEEMLCQGLNEAYIHKMLTGKPFVTLRYPSSLNDGIIKVLGKEAKEPGGYYSKLLQENDGLVIPSSSLMDNDKLPSSKETDAKQPLVVIISNSKTSPLRLPTLSVESGARAVLIVDKNTVIEPETEFNIKQQALEIVVLEQVNFPSILDYCSHQGICSLLLDPCNEEVGYDEVFVDVEDHVQKVVMEASPAWGETKENSVLKLGKKTLKVKDMQSREQTLLEGYVA